MKNIFIFVLSLMLVSTASYGRTLDWLRPMVDPETATWNLERLQDSMELYDCGLEKDNQEFCSDVTKYYNVDVDSRLYVKDERVLEIEITAPYSSFFYSELLLNLRKDGYVLAQAVIGDNDYDAIEELKTKPLKLVNREMVMFLNQGPISSKRQLTWYPNSEYYKQQPSRFAVFTSSEQGIKLTFQRLE